MTAGAARRRKPCDTMQAKLVPGVGEIPAQAWNALLADDYPFVRHEFLQLLEETGCVGAEQGWQPAHVVVENERGALVGAAPAYLKYHSFGEFVFDWAWADAYERAGGRYYPKLLNAVPFTPTAGPRLLAHDGAAAAAVAQAMRALTDDLDLSSAHALFLRPEEAPRYAVQGFLERRDCQYQWFNAGYDSFDAFLDALSAAKRKKIRRERRRVREAGIHIEAVPGEEIEDALWNQIYGFYANTYHERGQDPYLTPDFFPRLARAMPGRVVVFLARDDSGPVAAALTLRDSQTLYGRHWGCLADYHSLHFEACYYQGIEYCIRQGLSRFDAGVQGEHKLSRGFLPVATRSAHWIADERFREAVEDFLRRERALVERRIEAQQARTPYKQALEQP